MNFISEILGSVFEWINGFTHNYGLSIILFTIMFRLVLLPFDIRSRVGQREYTMKLKKIQPELDMINKAYKNNPEKASQQAMEVRKREGIGMMPKGCGTMLLTYPILIAFFAVFRNIAAEKIVELSTLTDVGAINNWFDTNSFLWVKNIWQPDVYFNFSETWGLRTLWVIKNVDGHIVPATLNPDTAVTVMNNLQATLQSAFKNGLVQEIGSAYNAESLETFATGVFQGLQNVMQIGNISEYGNGFYILPLLAGAVQVLSLKFSGQQTQPQGTDMQAQQAASTGKFMQIFFPLMFVYFCLVSSTALAIYWVTSSLCMILANFVINKVLDARDKKKEAEGEK